MTTRTTSRPWFSVRVRTLMLAVAGFAFGVGAFRDLQARLVPPLDPLVAEGLAKANEHVAAGLDRRTLDDDWFERSPYNFSDAEKVILRERHKERAIISEKQARAAREQAARLRVRPNQVKPSVARIVIQLLGFLGCYAILGFFLFQRVHKRPRYGEPSTSPPEQMGPREVRPR